MAEFHRRLVQLVWSQGLLLGLRFDLPVIDVLRRQAPAPASQPNASVAPGRKRSRAA
jgi:hypothetical protein